MKKYNIDNKPFYLPENLNEFEENSSNIIIISYKKGRYKTSETLLNDDNELIETLKNNICLFKNSAFIDLCKYKYQIIEQVYN
ncbi:hypothetical protein, partial [Brachyspira hampsonii]|uniref:hypothetical protein n=1 Tax=Brachyspira hampsonii TaxID=1287055 RepID=UPI000D4162C1